MEAHRPQEGEGPAHPPPVAGGKAGGRPGGAPAERLAPEKKVALEASKERASKEDQRGKAEEEEASKNHSRPVFQGDRARQDRTRSEASPAHRDRDPKEAQEEEVEVKKEEEAADFSGGEKKEEACIS